MCHEGMSPTIQAAWTAGVQRVVQEVHSRAEATAQSPARPLDLLVRAADPGRMGIPASVRISASSSTARYGPSVNSMAGTVRAPEADRMTRVARRVRRPPTDPPPGLVQRPADRAAVAHDRVGDHPLGVMKDPVVLADDGRLQDGAMVSAVQRPDNDVAPGSAAPRTVGRSVDRVRSIESPLPALVPVARGPKPATRCVRRGATAPGR